MLTRATELFGRHVSGFACLEGKGQNTFLLQGDIATGSDGDLGLGIEINPDGLQRYQKGHQDLTASDKVV